MSKLEDINNILRDIEDKILERGLLNKYIGNQYELSIVSLDHVDEIYTAQIKIKCTDSTVVLSEEDAESICDFVSEKFQEIDDEIYEDMEFSTYFNNIKIY